MCNAQGNGEGGLIIQFSFAPISCRLMFLLVTMLAFVPEGHCSFVTLSRLPSPYRHITPILQRTIQLDNNSSTDMDSQSKANSTASKSLLSRQLASITDALAKVSQRRKVEANRSCRASKLSTVGTDLAPRFEPALPAPVGEQDRSEPKQVPAQLDVTTFTIYRKTLGRRCHTHCLFST